MLELYTSEPNTFFLKPLIALHEKQATVRHPLVRRRELRTIRNWHSRMKSKRSCISSVKDRCCGMTAHDLQFGIHARVHRRGAARRTDCSRRTLTISIARMPRRSFSAGTSARSCHPRLHEISGAETRRARSGQARCAIWRRSSPRNAARAGRRCSTARTRRDPGHRARSAEISAVQRVEKQLAEGPWLAGPAFSIADIDAFALLSTVPDLAPELVNDSATPRLMEFLARIAARPRQGCARDITQWKTRAALRAGRRAISMGLKCELSELVASNE